MKKLSEPLTSSLGVGVLPLFQVSKAIFTAYKCCMFINPVVNIAKGVFINQF